MEALEQRPAPRSPTPRSGPDMTRCPHCRMPAEILRRDVLDSTDGPVEHILIQCVHRHRFYLPTSMTTQADQMSAYEQRFVPALFAQLAPWLVNQVDIDWRRGNVAALPFEDDTFDVVLCQSGLMFFPDATAALAEMAQVAASGGTVGVQVFARLDAQPAYGPWIGMIAEHAGPQALNLLGTYWIHGDLDVLADRFATTGERSPHRALRAGHEHGEAEAITDQLTGVVYERTQSPAERAEFAEPVGRVGSRILG